MTITDTERGDLPTILRRSVSPEISLFVRNPASYPVSPLKPKRYHHAVEEDVLPQFRVGIVEKASIFLER